jgi:hypothetical protein
MAAYVGTYSDPLHGEVAITQVGDRLHARYGGAFAGTLEHWHYDSFRATWDAEWRGTALLTFVLDGDGKPARLETMGARFARTQE